MTYTRASSRQDNFFSREVNDHVANTVIAQMLFLDAENSERDIHLYINSGGGLVTAGLAVFDTMRHINSPVSTTCSMAAFLLAAGEKGCAICCQTPEP